MIVHHIVSDQVSLGILFDDLVIAYRARVRGKAPRWATLPIQFADYALWQRNALDSDWGRAELRYWCAALAGLPDEISVAPDRPRPPALGKRGVMASFTVSAARRTALTQLAEHNGATEFMVYQAVLAVLLHKLGGGTDIALGSPVASRVESRTASLIGLFANMVVLRNDLSGDPSPRTMLARSRDTVLDAFAHQELPIERLVEALNPARSLSRNPLFQSMIHFRGADRALTPRDLTGTGETTVVVLSLDFEVSLVDLDVGMTVTADGELDVRVVGNADLYEEATVALIADALNAALDAFATTGPSGIHLGVAAGSRPGEAARWAGPTRRRAAGADHRRFGGNRTGPDRLAGRVARHHRRRPGRQLLRSGRRQHHLHQVVGAGHRTGTGFHPGNGVRAHDHRRAGRGGRCGRRSTCGRGGFGARAAVLADERIGPESRSVGRAHRVLAQAAVIAVMSTAPPQIEDVLALSPCRKGCLPCTGWPKAASTSTACSS